MWRRTYLALVLLRLYFALSPSYLHPDEHFQGPEVIASHLFDSPPDLTWEFTSDHPIRSTFPLWISYGLPLTLFKRIWEGFGYGPVPPTVVFYVLRMVMFMYSFVLEDWALHELLPNHRERRLGIILVASSYVTWTWQNHTFSNSFETLILLGSLVLIQRIKEDEKRSQLMRSTILAFLGVLGTFNRITFPAFLAIPMFQLIPHFRLAPLSLLAMVISASVTLFLAIADDTTWYAQADVHFSNLRKLAVVTPWNNLMYNFDPANLAQHGLHPYYQHFLVNLPQLIGPALVLLIFNFRSSIHLYSALFGTLVLSCFGHQEARFLMPAVPLVLASVDLPKRYAKVFAAVWIIFNAILGVLMGVYHQGGVVPAQLWISKQDNINHAFWWKTLMPPTYLLGQKAHTITTFDLMGRPGANMTADVASSVSCESAADSVLVAPHSAIYLDQYLTKTAAGSDLPFTLEHLWTYRNHLNMDDIDPGEEGVMGTLQRVVGRRGIGVWKIHRKCT